MNSKNLSFKLLMIFGLTWAITLLCGYFSFLFLSLTYISFGWFINVKRRDNVLNKEIFKNKEIIINCNTNNKTYYPSPMYKRSKKLIKKKVRY